MKFQLFSGSIAKNPEATNAGSVRETLPQREVPSALRLLGVIDKGVENLNISIPQQWRYAQTNPERVNLAHEVGGDAISKTAEPENAVEQKTDEILSMMMGPKYDQANTASINAQSTAAPGEITVESAQAAVEAALSGAPVPAAKKSDYELAA